MKNIFKLITNSKFLKKLNSKWNKNPSSKDLLKSAKFSTWNSKNIDFKKLKENLNSDVYDDEKLTANVVNFVRENLGSTIEIQWETNKGNKIIKKIIGSEKHVDFSNLLIKRAKNGSTKQIIHNHTSKVVLPSGADLINMVKYKVENSAIVGGYGVLNVKNSFKVLTDTEMSSISKTYNLIYMKFEREFYKNYSHFKGKKLNVVKIPKYKYYENNINNIVSEYNEKFNKYGISFKFTPFNLKKG